MVSKTAQADIEEMWEAGLRPTFADIIRLNAIALRRERCNRPDLSLFHLRRCAFLGDGSDRVIFREPCLGHEIWIDEIEAIVDLDNPETHFAVDAFVCGVEVDDLPPSMDRAAIVNAAETFLKRLTHFPRGQVAAAVTYCKIGADPLRGEVATPKPNDGDDEVDCHSFSIPIGVVRHGLAIGIGVTLDEALRIPRGAFEAMVEAHCRRNGGFDEKHRGSRFEDDYLRTLDEVTARLKVEQT